MGDQINTTEPGWVKKSTIDATEGFSKPSMLDFDTMVGWRWVKKSTIDATEGFSKPSVLDFDTMVGWRWV